MTVSCFDCNVVAVLESEHPSIILPLPYSASSASWAAMPCTSLRAARPPHVKSAAGAQSERRASREPRSDSPPLRPPTCAEALACAAFPRTCHSTRLCMARAAPTAARQCRAAKHQAATRGCRAPSSTGGDGAHPAAAFRWTFCVGGHGPRMTTRQVSSRARSLVARWLAARPRHECVAGGAPSGSRGTCGEGHGAREYSPEVAARRQMADEAERYWRRWRRGGG